MQIISLHIIAIDEANNVEKIISRTSLTPGLMTPDASVMVVLNGLRNTIDVDNTLVITNPLKAIIINVMSDFNFKSLLIMYYSSSGVLSFFLISFVFAFINFSACSFSPSIGYLMERPCINSSVTVLTVNG